MKKREEETLVMVNGKKYFVDFGSVVDGEHISYKEMLANYGDAIKAINQAVLTGQKTKMKWVQDRAIEFDLGFDTGLTNDELVYALGYYDDFYYIDINNGKSTEEIGEALLGWRFHWRQFGGFAYQAYLGSVYYPYDEPGRIYFRMTPKFEEIILKNKRGIGSLPLSQIIQELETR